jgi:hypothetical protein
MRPFSVIVGIVVRGSFTLSLAASPAIAAAFDGSRSFTCAALAASSCTVDEACRNETPESLNAPRFMRISVADKTITGQFPDRPDKTTPIQFVEHEAGQMFLGGIDGALTWHADIDEENGKMSLAADRIAKDEQYAIVLLGACTPS